MLPHIGKHAKIASLALRRAYTGVYRLFPKSPIISPKRNAVRTLSSHFQGFWLVPCNRRFSRHILKEENPISDSDKRAQHLNPPPRLQLLPNCSVACAISLNCIFNHKSCKVLVAKAEGTLGAHAMCLRGTEKIQYLLEMHRR